MYPRLRDQLVVDTYRGQVRIRKWPKKRGTPKSEAVRAQNQIFADAMKVIKLADASQYDAAQKLVKNSGLYPRDIILSAMLKGFVVLHLADGRTIRPWDRTIEEVNVQSTHVEKTSTQSVSAGATVQVQWQNPIIDDLGMFSAVNPTRLTVPNNVSRIEVITGIQFTTLTSGSRGAFIRKNGTTVVARAISIGGTNFGFSLDTGPLPVIAGDYFEALAFSSVADTITLAPATFIACNVLKAP